MLGAQHAHAKGKLKAVLGSPLLDLVGICEPDQRIQEKFKRSPEFQEVPWVSQGALLEDPSIELILVESRVEQLVELGRAAVDAGKHIHMDKPGGTSLSAFRELLDQAEDKGLLVQMGYMFRYNPGFDLVRRAVWEGWLGNVYNIYATMNKDLPEKRRREFAFHSGGMMLELGCHLIDMIVLLMGEPNRVISFLRSDGGFDDGLSDNTVAILEFEKALATVEVGAMEPEAEVARRFKVTGDRGSVFMEPMEPPCVRMCLREPTAGYRAGWQSLAIRDEPRYVRDIEDLAHCIQGEATFQYSYEHDYIVQKTLLHACAGGDR